MLLVPEMSELSVLCNSAFGSCHFQRHRGSPWCKTVAQQASLLLCVTGLSGLQKVSGSVISGMLAFVLTKFTLTH